MAELAITITLRPSMFRHDLKKQYDKLKEALNSCPFMISAVCELTNSGNLHAHGIVAEFRHTQYGSFKQYVIEHFRTSKVVGFICLKEMDNREKWLDYCFKNYIDTKYDLYFGRTVIIDELISFPRGLDIIKYYNNTNGSFADVKDIMLCDDCLFDRT